MKPSLHQTLPPVATRAETIAVSLIHPSPLNPRMVAESERAALAPSLLASGQLQRIWVRPHPEQAGHFELVDGERRWWGAKEAQLETLEADVGDWTNEHVLQITWTTGTQGKGLTAIEEARWAEGAMRQQGATLQSVGALVGVTGTELHKRLALLETPAHVQAAVQTGKLPASTAYLIGGVPGPAREEFAREVMHPDDEAGPLSYVAAEALRRAKYMRTLKGSPFDVADADLLPSAGACSTCRFRAGNNTEEYGDVKSPHTCMHVACYAEKVEAVRTRLAAREAGKVALSAEVNATVFPDGAVEPEPTSGYVLAARPIPDDLVKAEVAAEGAPSFAQISPAAAVFIGTDGQGRCVDLVRVDEAITVATEPDIFRAEVIASHGLRDNRGGTHRNSDDEVVTTPSMRDATPAQSAPVAGSIAADEKRKNRAEASAERAQAKKLRICAEWAEQLFDALSAAGQPAGYAYTRASLRWEHILRSVADEDALLVVRALTDEDPKKAAAKASLAEFVSTLKRTEELEAVNDLLMIAPALRAQGVDAAWVVDWHKHLIASLEARVAAAAPAPAAPAMPEEERQKWAEVTKAHTGGMPLAEIARSFEMELADVCGALGVPVPEADRVIGADDPEYGDLDETSRRAVALLLGGKSAQEAATATKLKLAQVILLRWRIDKKRGPAQP